MKTWGVGKSWKEGGGWDISVILSKTKIYFKKRKSINMLFIVVNARITDPFPTSLCCSEEVTHSTLRDGV